MELIILSNTKLAIYIYIIDIDVYFHCIHTLDDDHCIKEKVNYVQPDWIGVGGFDVGAWDGCWIWETWLATNSAKRSGVWTKYIFTILTLTMKWFRQQIMHTSFKQKLWCWRSWVWCLLEISETPFFYLWVIIESNFHI